MEKINNLRDMLVYDLRELYLAERQISDVIPIKIEMAKSPELKAVLQEHLHISESHLSRLEEIWQLLRKEAAGNKDGILSNLLGGSDKNKGIEGILEEAKKKLAEDIDDKVRDAALIGCVQKMKHFAICSYGTARTYAVQLGLTEVANLLQNSLEEEHEADDQLTEMAVADSNIKAIDVESRN
jgi:ferritin-like metal-binding protein YciE